MAEKKRRRTRFGRGDVVADLNAPPKTGKYRFVVGRRQDKLIALRLKTDRWGRLVPTRQLVALDAGQVALVVGRPNAASARFDDAAYRRLVAASRSGSFKPHYTNRKKGGQ